MPTKTKPAKKIEGADSLESKLDSAIKMVSSNKAGDAIPLFETIVKEAEKVGNYGIARIANSYIANKQQKKVNPVKADPIQEAVFLLNAGQSETALEKIQVILKTQNSNANAHYLKALALASTEQFELSSDSLKKAIDIDPALLHVYKLEPDFKLCRKLPEFADFELE